jgi:preprotein translocase subunit YajC
VFSFVKPSETRKKIIFKEMNMRRIFCVLAITFLALLPASAQMQERGSGGRNMPPGENTIGKVTAVSKDSLTIAPTQGGDAITVKVSETTRVTKNRQPFKLEDIKADETVFARGELKNGVMQAAMVAVINPEMAQRFQGGGGMGGMRGGRQMEGFKPEDMGKKFIVGQVKAINETKLTIARPDGQTQEIEVDENTSFKKDGQSVTLPDIKIGDFVHGQGALKGETFVPKELIVGGGQRRMRGQGNQTQEQNKPENMPPVGAPAASSTPASTTPTATPK